jgi:uncharacterized membrane protein
MITVEVTASVMYTCELTEEDSEKVKAYAEANDVTLAYAVDVLYSMGEIHLYKNSVESDFNTETIDGAYEE